MGRDGRRLTEAARGRSLVQGATSAGGKRLEKGEDRSNLSFSFQFYRQIPYFETGEQDNQWFSSLLARLKDLSGKDSSLMGDATAKDAYRLHPIKWDQPRIPVKKEDLNWIPTAYRENSAIEFHQFEISQAMGRVVGFFNETNEVFYIVLLDPKHNIQPTQKTGYRVDATRRSLTDYEELLLQIQANKVAAKHTDRANRLIWVEEELSEVFLKYGIVEWQEMLSEILMDKYLEG